MTSISAHELTRTVYCKEFGCEQERRYDRGPAVGLCVEHGRPVLSENGRNAVRHKKIQSVAKGAVAELAVDVVNRARVYDRASKRARAADDALQDARLDLQTSIRRVLLRLQEDAT